MLCGPPQILGGLAALARFTGAASARQLPPVPEALAGLREAAPALDPSPFPATHGDTITITAMFFGPAGPLVTNRLAPVVPTGNTVTSPHPPIDTGRLPGIGNLGWRDRAR